MTTSEPEGFERTEQGLWNTDVCVDSLLVSVCVSDVLFFLLARRESSFQRSWNVSLL